MANSYAGIVILALIVCSTTVEIPFVLGKATCMALMSSFDVFSSHSAYKSRITFAKYW